MNRWKYCALMFVAALGCSKTTDVAPEEPAVRAAVDALRAAIKADDVARIWELLDSKAQTDADQAAEALRAKYKQADAAGKAAIEKEVGLASAELEKLTGQDYLKSKLFKKKYDELPESTINKVSVTGKQATVNYTEPDGDKESLTVMLRDGKWKFVLTMPK